MTTQRLVIHPTFPSTFSPCRRYRYEWHHRWDEGEMCMFIGLNPSTANAFHMDPTVRRCVDYARRWGFGALCMTNLFAWRDTDPEAMKRQPRPIGPRNDATLKRLAAQSGLVVAAWGCHGSHLQRGDAVRVMLPNLHALKVNQDGSPAHPLYLRKDLQPCRF